MSQDCIEAFILTYNRKEFLKSSVQSLFNQSIGNIKITIMDNCSTDGTCKLVQDLQKEFSNISYFCQEKNVSFVENFKTAVNIATSEYVMMFHDDDILHPDYLKSAMEIFNKYPNVSVVSSCYKECSAPTNENWEKVSKKFFYCPSKNDFVDFLCYIQRFGYPPVIYKLSGLKNVNYDKWRNSVYTKLLDKPMVIESMQDDDAAAIFMDKNFLRYRVHAGQDTKTSGPCEEEIIEFNKFYKNFMQRNWYSNFLFNLINYKQLRSAFIWGRDNDTVLLNTFIKKAIDEGAGCKYTELCISPFGRLFIEIAHILRKIFKSRYKIKSL